jgi:hypothetical protein
MSSHYLQVFVGPQQRNRPQDTHFYVPGEQVSGIVKLQLTKDVRIDQIQVVLKEKCRLRRGSGKRQVDWKLLMFDLEHSILEGPVDMSSGTYQYPFSFIFPRTFTPQDWRFTDTTSPLYGQQNESMLPPTSTGTGRNAGYRVYYTISAKIPRSLRAWKAKTMVNFMTVRNDMDPPQSRVTCKTNSNVEHIYRIDHSGVPRALGRRESFMKSIYVSMDTSAIQISMKVDAPTSIIIGKSYDIEMILIAADSRGNVDAIPPYRVKNCTLRLKTFETLRYPTTSDWSEGSIESHQLIATLDTDELMTFDSPKVFSNLFSWSDPKLIPDFHSCYINHESWLELKVVIESLGEDLSFKFHWKDVTVHAAVIDQEVVAAIRRIEDAGGDTGKAANEFPPPPYKE